MKQRISLSAFCLLPTAVGEAARDSAGMNHAAENLWVLTYSLKLLGADLHRVVTVIRLNSGELVIHSTGPFTPGHVAAIQVLGKPGWLVDAMLRHDTFAKEGRAAFPDIPYLAPEGFVAGPGIITHPILPAPPAWGDELEALKIEGVPSMDEYVFFHRPSRTLIVADLFFDFGPDAPAWTKFMSLLVSGHTHGPGMSRPLRFSAKDKDALKASLQKMMEWDFDRLIVGHGDHVENEAKAKVAEALRAGGF